MSEPFGIERLIADDFREPPIYDIQDTVSRLLRAQRDHGGRQPSHITGCYTQVRKWEDDMLLFPRDKPDVKRLMKIMNVTVIERPGPATVIWSEALA